MADPAVLTRWVYDFDTAPADDTHLLGGKGAGLAAMTRLGLTVPPGFTVTTEACRHRMEHGSDPAELIDQIDDAVARLEGATGRTFGGGPAPLLLSVRSGAAVSMPGMMDTVLNIGLNDDLVTVLAEWADDPHFAFDAYRRFLQMYADVVLGVDHEHFATAIDAARAKAGVDNDALLSADDLRALVATYRTIIDDAGVTVPDDPREQLHQAISAVFASWDTPRAKHYRRMSSIPDTLGTAANVQMMVFGDLGPTSGTGVCFTRDPNNGASSPYGDYLPQAQGEDVVAGIRNTLSLDEFSDRHPEVHAELVDVMKALERDSREMCDIEFTVERQKLWILQTRTGKRSAHAAVRIAVEMVEEGLISIEEALNRVDPSTLEQLDRPRLADHDTEPLATGIGASPGAAQGRVALTSQRAVDAAAAGDRVILVRPETTPDDIAGMDAADGILTAQGGKTSHAAVVARGLGTPAVTGTAAVTVQASAGTVRIGDVTIEEGDEITIDGTTGSVYLGLLELVEPEETPGLEQLLAWADEVRAIGIYANADTGPDAAAARAAGAEGIGLARTEHMFLGERLGNVQRLILSEDASEKEEALDELRREQTDDFEALLEAMDGLPVVVRLLDPPLHEFLPSIREVEHRMRDGDGDQADLEKLLAEVERWQEDNPMLGLRGVRLGLMVEHLYEMQTEACILAVKRRRAAGGDPRLKIMIPLVSTTAELERMKDMIIAKVDEAFPGEVHIQVGTMIELPRAALIAGDIATVADFFSFGTNDLTQMTFGLSRDDAEGSFLHRYLDEGILETDPFQTIDVTGVGRLVALAAAEGRATNPNLELGVCGEHGGDPDSISFFRSVGLDYVSCSPPRLHVARLAAAQTEIERMHADARPPEPESAAL